MVGRVSDFNFVVNEIGSWWCIFLCVVFMDVFGFWEEVEEIVFVEFGLVNYVVL